MLDKKSKVLLIIALTPVFLFLMIFGHLTVPFFFISSDHVHSTIYEKSLKETSLSEFVKQYPFATNIETFHEMDAWATIWVKGKSDTNKVSYSISYDRLYLHPRLESASCTNLESGEKIKADQPDLDKHIKSESLCP